MKSVLIVCLSFLVLGITSCDDNEEPTTFRGEVVFPEDYEQNGEISLTIIGIKSRGIGTPVDNVADTSVILDQSRHFDVTFPAIDVQKYAMLIELLNNGAIVEDWKGSQLNCSSYDCDNLEPGKSYDLTIEVLE